MKNLFLFTVFASLIVLGGCSQREAQEQEQNTAPSMEVSAEHCKMMPDMPGCEQYRTTGDIETGSKGQNDHNTTGHTMTMNHADMVSDELSFISEMIPHHQEAVDTSTTLLAKTQNPKLKTMLENIIKGQAKEITMMKGRLSDYHAGSDYKATYMPMMRDTSTVSAITTLEKMYIEDMIAHHQGAVDMAIKLLDIMHKQDPVIKLTEAGMKHRNEVKAFAQAIIQDQTREIAEFVQLLKAY